MSLLKNLKISNKTVLFNFKRYICFFVMLFLIETLFSSVLVLYTNNNRNQLDYLSDTYNYHLQLQNLNDVQYSYVLQKYQKQENGFETFFTVSSVKHPLSDSGARYDLNILFADRVSENYKFFSETYYKALGEEGEFGEFRTPLLTYEIDYASNTAICGLTCLFIFLCGCIIIYILDSIMVNHYKFVYGVYMTFGADFKKLFLTAFGEMAIISLIVFIPSQLISNAVCFLIINKNGLAFTLSVPAVILSLIMGVAVAATAVFINIRRVSRKTPLKLIEAVDNANLITSPRESSDFFGFTFPKHTELLSFRRFGKYALTLLLSVITFASAFTGCVYLRGAYLKTISYRKPQYDIYFSGNAQYTENEDGYITESLSFKHLYNDEIKELIYGFDGVKKVIKECSADAAEVCAPVKIPKDKLRGSGVGVSVDDDFNAFLNASYTALDSEVADIISYYGYNVEGSLEDVISDKSMIAITDGYKNSVKFDLKVGDTIYIATRYSRNKTVNSLITSDLDLILASYLESYDFTYNEFTVGAVIHDMPLGDSFAVYMNEAAYITVTNRSVYYDKIQIITNEGLSAKDYTQLTNNLRSAADYYDNMVVTNLDTEVNSGMEKNKSYESVYLFVAFMLLLVAPVIWLFSQILFYLKRRPEFDIYFALGASGESIKKLFITDTLIIASAVALAYTLFTLGLLFVLSSFVNSSFYSASAYLRFGFDFPTVGFIIGLAVTLVGAIISTMQPYYAYIKACHPVFTGADKHTKQALISEGETGL